MDQTLDLDATEQDTTVLTGNPGVDRMFLDSLDGQSLINVCQSNSYTQHLCNEEFWRSKIGADFSPYLVDKPDYLTYPQYYREILFVFNRLNTFRLKKVLIKHFFENEDFTKIKITYELLPKYRDLIIKWIVSSYKGLRPNVLNWAIQDQRLLEGLKSKSQEIINLSNNYEDNIQVFTTFISELDEEQQKAARVRLILEKIPSTLDFNDLLNDGIVSEKDIVDALFVDHVLYEHEFEEEVKKYLDQGYVPDWDTEKMAIEAHNVNALDRLVRYGYVPTQEGKQLAEHENRHVITRWYREHGL